MKTVKLSTGIEISGEQKLFYAEYDFLVSAINFAPQGVDIAETFARQRLIQSLEPAAHTSMHNRNLESLNDSFLEETVEVSLEDADYTKMQALLRGMKWQKPLKSILELAKKFDIKS